MHGNIKQVEKGKSMFDFLKKNDNELEERIKKQTLTINGIEDKLTTKESDLLALLCANSNEILERNMALKTIWEEDSYFNARSMDVYITKLRKRLKDDPEVEIINVHGKGYKLVFPQDS